MKNDQHTWFPIGTHAHIWWCYVAVKNQSDIDSKFNLELLELRSKFIKLFYSNLESHEGGYIR